MLLACSACTDTLLMQHGWWVRVPVGICLAFVIDGLIALLLRATGRHRGGTWWPGLVAAPIVSVVLAVGGVVIAHTILAVFLVVRFGVAVLRTAPQLRWLRGAVVASVIFSFSVGSMPGNRSTDELLRAERVGFIYRGGLVAANWMEEELQRRPEAIELVEAAMKPKVIDPKLLRLHYVMGGSRAARNSMCSFVRGAETVDEQTREICRRDELSRE